MPAPVTVMVWVLCVVFHWYDTKFPVALNVPLLPGQSETVPEIVGVGKGCAVALWDATAVQPSTSVTVTA